MSPLFTPPLTAVTVISPASKEYFSEFQEIVGRVHKERKGLKIAVPAGYETHDNLPLPRGYDRSWGTSFESVAILPAGKGQKKEIPVTVLLQEAQPLTAAEADDEHRFFTLTIDEYDQFATSSIHNDMQPFNKLIFEANLKQVAPPKK